VTELMALPWELVRHSGEGPPHECPDPARRVV